MTDTTFKFLVTCIHKSKDEFDKAKEEVRLKYKIAALLNKEKYKFVIVGPEYIKK